MNMLETMMEAAKRNLVKYGNVAPVFFLIRGEKLVIPPVLMAKLNAVRAAYGLEGLNAEDTKTQDSILIGGMAKTLGADRVILIWDGAFRAVDPETPYNDLEAPLTYPKSMRTECIIANEVFLPSGQDNVLMVPYKGGEGEPVEFIQNDKITQALKGGKFQSRFTELILEGYNKAGI